MFTITATRDAVLSAPLSPATALRTYVVASNGATYAVLGTDGEDGVFAVSERTGQIVHARAYRHSRVNGDRVLVRIAYAVDTDDAAGTLRFDHSPHYGTYGYTHPSALEPASLAAIPR